MTARAIHEIQEIRKVLNDWLVSFGEKPEQITYASLQQVSLQLHRADELLAHFPTERNSSSEWQEELANYRTTLDVVKNQLERLTQLLQIRRMEMAGKQTQLDAANSWAALARRIG